MTGANDLREPPALLGQGRPSRRSQTLPPAKAAAASFPPAIGTANRARWQPRPCAGRAGGIKGSTPENEC